MRLPRPPIAAALFDATGKIARRLPLKPAYVQTLLKACGWFRFVRRALATCASMARRARPRTATDILTCIR